MYLWSGLECYFPELSNVKEVSIVSLETSFDEEPFFSKGERRGSHRMSYIQDGFDDSHRTECHPE